MTDIVHRDLSYEIMGAAFEVFNELGPGHKEKYYQKALAKAFEDKDLKFKEQVRTELKFRDEVMGVHIVDFIVNDQVAVEIKKKPRFSRADFNQALSYLQSFQLELALLITFGHSEVLSRRVLNIKQ